MLDPTDRRFLELLATEGAQMTGDDAPCVQAARTALESAHPDDLRRARQHVEALPPQSRDKLMRAVHRGLATDLSAIRDQLPGKPPTGRAH